MKPDEECGYCTTLLDAHCTLHGPSFCDIKEQYFADSTMGIDEVYEALYAIATPEQINEASRMVRSRHAQGIPAVDPSSSSSVDAQSAQEAAQKWLTHWQQGKR